VNIVEKIHSIINPLGSKVFLGFLMFWHGLTFVLFSVVYKHIIGTGEMTLYLVQTGLP